MYRSGRQVASDAWREERQQIERIMANGVEPSAEAVADLARREPREVALAQGSEETVYLGGYEVTAPARDGGTTCYWQDCSRWAIPLVTRGPRGGLHVRYVLHREAEFIRLEY